MSAIITFQSPACTLTLEEVAITFIVHTGSVLCRCALFRFSSAPPTYIYIYICYTVRVQTRRGLRSKVGRKTTWLSCSRSFIYGFTLTLTAFQWRYEKQQQSQ